VEEGDTNLSSVKREGDFFVIYLRDDAYLAEANAFIANEAHNFTQKSFLLVLDFVLTSELEMTMTKSLANANKNGLFFMVNKEETENALTWRQIVTVKNQQQVVMDSLTFGNFHNYGE